MKLLIIQFPLPYSYLLFLMNPLILLVYQSTGWDMMLYR
jgi:hypothetical protein